MKGFTTMPNTSRGRISFLASRASARFSGFSRRVPTMSCMLCWSSTVLYATSFMTASRSTWRAILAKKPKRRANSVTQPQFG
jgi:hypothetical protein